MNHTNEAQQRIDELVDYLRDAIPRIDNPRGQALFETGAEVLLGLNKAFAHYARKNEPAWHAGETSADTGTASGVAVPGDPHVIEDKYNTHDASFRRHYQLNYSGGEHEYEFYASAYRLGYELAEEGRDLKWQAAEAGAKRHWQTAHASAWDDVADAVRYGWEEQRNPEALRVHHEGEYPKFRDSFEAHYAESLRGSGLPFEKYEPAYRYGYDLGIDPETREGVWADMEPAVRKYYETEYADGEPDWEHYREAAHHAWYSARGAAV